MKIIYKKISSYKYNILLVSNKNKYIDYFGYKIVHKGKNIFFYVDIFLIKKYLSSGLVLNVDLKNIYMLLNE